MDSKTLTVKSEDDGVMGVYRGSKRLGAIVKWITWNGVKMFRAFGEDFTSFSVALAEFDRCR